MKMMFKSGVCGAVAFAQMCAFAVSDAELNNSAEMNRGVTAPTYRRAVEGGVRVLFIGNSITLHAPKPSIGWTSFCGMAASAREKDFVHLVTAGIERKTGRKADLLVRNLADFERGFESYDLKLIDDLVAFRPDYLVVSLGENVRPLKDDADRAAFRTSFRNLLKRFSEVERSRFVVKGAFWPNQSRDEIIGQVANELAVCFVSAPCRGNADRALGLFAHAGVANHPGDEGMKMMADKVLDALASQGPLQVGFSRVDITPPMGIFMPGYYIDRRAKEVLDPLQVNCVAFSDGDNRAVVMQIDTEALSDPVADGMRDAVSRKTGIDRDSVLLHATHTHDGGHLAVGQKMGASSVGRGEDELATLYVRMATSRVADAAVLALGDLKPARLSIGRSNAPRISFGRRYLMKNGKVQTNPGVGNPDIVRPSGNVPDDVVQVLRIDRKDAPAIAVLNFQCHPDVIGGETISADWPGLTRQVFEAATMGAAKCLVLNGAEGDLNHVNVLPRPGETNGLHRDFDNVDRGYDHAKHMANVIAGAALSVWMKCVPVSVGRVRARVRTVKVPAQRAKTDEELRRADEVWKTHEAGRDAELPWKGMELTTELARARRIRNLRNGPDAFDIPVYAVAVGDSVAFEAFPGEPFNGIGIEIRSKSPFRMTLLSCLTNGSRGYFPFSDCYRQGGYESATSPFGPSVAEDLISSSIDLLEALR